MRNFIAAAALIALAACQQQAPPPTAAAVSSGPGCAKSATHQVTFSDANAPDTVTARAEGRTCAQAAIVLTITAANGDTLWAYADTYAVLQGGGVAPSQMPPEIANRMDQFLTDWANVTVKSTRDLPPWTAGAATLTDAVQGMSYSTPFDRETYERLRGQNLPDLCFTSGAESSTCIIMDPASHQPSLMVSFGA
ncbi:MAG: hypothetical protein ABUS48_04735 [Pseudomonadota bacterium]